MIILASGSPRRRELLTQVGVDFTVHVFEIDESPHDHETPAAYVARLAVSKAQAAIPHLPPQAIVIAADTTVTIDGVILGKPQDQADAMQMWQRLQGRTHQVLTGVAVCQGERCLRQVVCTEVVMRTVTNTEMLAYWQTGEPVGKAGAYAIQGRGAAWIPAIHGSYSNVVGLPLVETLTLLQQIQQQ